MSEASQMRGKCGTEGQNNAQDTFKKEVTSDKADEGQAAAAAGQETACIFLCRLVWG